MSVSIFDIERIVREVLAELGIGDALQPATAVETPCAAVPTVEANSAPSPAIAKAEVKKEEPVAQVACKNCSKPINAGMKFCPECGAAQ